MNCIPAINKKKTIDGNETNFFDGPQAKKVVISSLAAIIAVLNVTSSAYPLHPPVISDGWDHNKSYFTERERGGILLRIARERDYHTKKKKCVTRNGRMIISSFHSIFFIPCA